MTRSTLQALLASLVAALLLTGCSDMPKTTIDPSTVTELAPCPSSPNCVCSQQDESDSHYIAPIEIEGDAEQAWQTLQQILAERPRVEITASGEHYLHATATTLILRFTDDVEFLLDREAGVIHMRSASRVGYSDLGKNRSRMEDLRDRMVEAGVAADAP